MALNIKDDETDALVREVATLARESLARAVKISLQQRLERLKQERGPLARSERLSRFLETEAWPQLPPSVLGVSISKAEREEILGYGEAGL